MIVTFNDVYELIATQKAIIEKQDELIADKDIIISDLGEVVDDLSKIIDLQEKKIKKLNNVVNNSLHQKTVHWIDREVYDADRWKCSVCGRTEPYKENYCPNCGAKMAEPMESKK